MKVFCVVGIRASGKTTTLTRLAEEFRRRGRSVGTVKSIYCPTFTMDDPKSNTFRHRRAGAEIICARAKGETTLMFPRPMGNSEILSHYRDMDIVILEGDYLAPVPRLVAAHGPEDAQPRINDRTLAVVGRAAAGQKEVLNLPAFDPLSDIGALADFLEARVPQADLAALDRELPQVPGVTGDAFCQCGCLKHAKAAGGEAVSLTVGGEPLALTPEQRRLVLSWAQSPPPLPRHPTRG
jgi:molybdopterin-guanine dinucleotide biosynthesis protein MobB